MVLEISSNKIITERTRLEPVNVYAVRIVNGREPHSPPKLLN